MKLDKESILSIILIFVSFIPIGFGLLMANLMGWGGLEFIDALLQESVCYVPIILGFFMFCIGILSLRYPKIHNLIKVKFDNKEKP